MASNRHRLAPTKAADTGYVYVPPTTSLRTYMYFIRFLYSASSSVSGLEHLNPPSSSFYLAIPANLKGSGTSQR